MYYDISYINLNYGMDMKWKLNIIVYIINLRTPKARAQSIMGKKVW